MTTSIRREFKEIIYNWPQKDQMTYAFTRKVFRLLEHIGYTPNICKLIQNSTSDDTERNIINTILKSNENDWSISTKIYRWMLKLHRFLMCNHFISLFYSIYTLEFYIINSNLYNYCMNYFTQNNTNWFGQLNMDSVYYNDIPYDKRSSDRNNWIYDHNLKLYIVDRILGQRKLGYLLYDVGDFINNEIYIFESKVKRYDILYLLLMKFKILRKQLPQDDFYMFDNIERFFEKKICKDLTRMLYEYICMG